MVGAGVGARVGGIVGTCDGAGVGCAVGTHVGSGVGAGQIANSVAEQDAAGAEHAVAPQHELIVHELIVHAEASLRSDGPEHPSQSRVPTPASNESLGQRL